MNEDTSGVFWSSNPSWTASTSFRASGGLGCACGFGLRGRHLISTLSFGFLSCGPLLVLLSCGPLLVLLSLPAIWYLQANMFAIRDLQADVLAALLVEMTTTAHEDHGEDKSDNDADEDADDDPD
jgi:hypothetical protein